MAQTIKQGNLFGRIGSGVGKGLAEQLPKEIERNRLSAGLEKLGQQKDLTPFQQFSALAAIPGITPQMIQSGSDLLRQQARGQALANYQESQNQPKPSPFGQPKPQTQNQPAQNAPSITQENPLAQIQEGAIPPTKEQEFERAGQLFNENPARFGNDPQKALDFVTEETARNVAINQAYQQKHENLSKIQDNVVNRLNAQYQKLTGDKGDKTPAVPAELYSKIEDKAIQATKSRKEGGEGLTEQQAMKKYGDELNEAARQFAKIGELGGWGLTLRPAQATLRSIKELQNQMEKLDQTDNFAKELISGGHSPSFAYAVAEPVYKVPAISNYIKQLPILEPFETIAETRPNPAIAIPKTLEVAPKLAQFVKDNPKASPLAIAYELEKKNYDKETWLKYLTDHQDELNLRGRQIQQLQTPTNALPTWNDWWLSSFTGIE